MVYAWKLMRWFNHSEPVGRFIPLYYKIGGVKGGRSWGRDCGGIGKDCFLGGS
jgi:hypothetical protein